MHFVSTTKCLSNTFAGREFNDVRDVCEIYMKLLQSLQDKRLMSARKGVSINQLLSLCKITEHQIEIEVDAKFVCK